MFAAARPAIRVPTLLESLSAKISVVGENRQIKRSVALTLIRRQVYEWHVFKVSIKARPFLVSHQPHHVAVPFRYIPAKMPPREIPNCYFQLPQSDTWRIDHRSVSFLKV